jgi:tetratricopeptide (TPR) repeat protein/uncharacterized caspase-like protein
MLKRSSRISLLILAFCFAIRIFSNEQTASATTQDSRTWALVIGVSKYPKLPGGQQLQFADRDAEAFTEALKKTGVPQENIRTLTGQQATASAIRSALGNWLARSASPDDRIYIFFSGHGLVEKEFGESYFLAHDSDIKDPYTTAISITEISSALNRRIKANQALIIADAVKRDLFPPDGDGPADTNAFVKSFNQIALSKPGASAILANSPGEFSREGQRWGGYGVFTKFLSEALAGSGDLNGDGVITTGEIFDFLSAKVSEDTSNRQRPWKTDNFVANLAVGRSQNVARVVTPPAAPSTQPAPQSQTQTSQSQSQQPVRPVAQSPHPTQQAPQTSRPQPPARSEPPTQKSDSTSSAAAVNKPVTQPETRKTETVIAPAPKRNEASVSSNPRTEERAATTPSPSRPAVTPPARGQIETSQPAPEKAPPVETARMETANLPPPSRPAIVPPSTSSVKSTSSVNQPSTTATSLPTTNAGAAPSPLILQIEAAISAGNLIEPRSTNAWELYQRLTQDQAASIDTARIKPRLADALEKSGIAIVRNGALSDKVTDRVDDFRRAGQMFARARSLAPKDDLANLEKLSAAQALIALQFFDEADRSLSQMQNIRSAEVENALGLVYQGKFDNWRAERAFKRAIEIDSSWYAPHYNLGLLYRSQGNEAAMESLGRAADLAKDNVIVLAAFGDECMNKQQWQRAIETYRKAVNQQPADDGLRTKLANALYSAGLRDEANREYQKASELRKRQ